MPQLPQPGDRLHPAHRRHPQVHQDHVDVDLLRDRDRLGAVAGLADHLELGVTAEQAAQPVPHDRVVVDDEQPDRGHRSTTGSGTAALSVVPYPGADSTVSVPPTPASRCRMPSRP